MIISLFLCIKGFNFAAYFYKNSFFYMVRINIILNLKCSLLHLGNVVFLSIFGNDVLNVLLLALGKLLRKLIL